MIEQPITALPGIGPRLKAAYERLGIRTVRDLLLAFPHRYDDYRQTEGIGHVRPGMSVTVRGTVTSVRSRRSPKKRMMLTEATVEDETGSITAVWFHQPYLVRQLRVGARLSLSGAVDDRYGLAIINPQFEMLAGLTGEGAIVDDAFTHTGRLVPVYSVSGRMAQKGRREAVRAALAYADELVDWLSDEVRERFDIAPIVASVCALHFPADAETWNRAVHRIKFDELLRHQLAHAQARRLRDSRRGVALPLQEEALRAQVARLPFVLTNAQRKAAYEIVCDMASGAPMHRLLEGDVGSGKTVVAALCAVNVAQNGYQTAYLAPTDLLARQQAVALKALMGDTACIALITSGECWLAGTVCRRAEALDALMDGRANVVVGTHALLQKDVALSALALVVIDEQHRFGVEQRRALLEPRADGTIPHVLSMTATPIPRTLAMALYGDMRVSILDELPPNRGCVETICLEPSDDARAFGLMRDRLAAGAQAFVICPFIQDSDACEADSVETMRRRLCEGALNGIVVEALHGRMKSADKAEVMRRFMAGDVRVLVSTTVVEVGVNVPRATVMFVEGAERFGLAQLHQLRGRVRRSSQPSVCFLHPSVRSQTAWQRLQAMVQHDDGFKLAELDLKMRGSGDRFGTRQSGDQEFQYASLSDHALIAQAREAAEWLLDCDALNTNSALNWKLEVRG